MTREELKHLLDSRTDAEFVEGELLERRPWIFQADAEYELWRGAVAQSLALPQQNVRIVGSAATGYSLSPLKAGRPFRPAHVNDRSSDIDVAFLHPGLFEATWDLILLNDRARALGGSDESRAMLRLDIYWGLIADRNVPKGTDPARRILAALGIAGRLPPIRGYPVRCRIYRRLEDLRAYHVASLRRLRSELARVGG